MELSADHPAFRSAVADVAAAAERLQRDRDRVARQRVGARAQRDQARDVLEHATPPRLVDALEVHRVALLRRVAGAEVVLVGELVAGEARQQGPAEEAGGPGEGPGSGAPGGRGGPGLERPPWRQGGVPHLLAW